jgi:hypothetical protein
MTIAKVLPDKIKVNQNVHLQSLAFTINDPKNGPKAGPESETTPHTPSPTGKYGTFTKSAKEAPTLANGVDPKNPAKNLNTVNSAIFLDKAMGIWNTAYMKVVMMYMEFLPINGFSENGEKIMVPIPYPMT